MNSRHVLHTFRFLWLIQATVYATAASADISSGTATDHFEDHSSAANQPELSAKAFEILTRSTDYVSALPAFFLAGKIVHEELGRDGHLLEFGSDIDSTIQRPAKAKLHIKSRDGTVSTLVLNGESLSILAVVNQTYLYDMTEQPGDINKSLNGLAAELGVPRQMKYFFSEDLTAALSRATSGYYVGEARINGVMCDHLAFRDDTRDIQVWISQGATPLPQRIVLRYRLAKGQPQVWIEISEWDLKPKLKKNTFKLTLPKQAERIEFFAE
jgi:hypothetical protein